MDNTNHIHIPNNKHNILDPNINWRHNIVRCKHMEHTTSHIHSNKHMARNIPNNHATQGGVKNGLQNEKCR